MRPQIAFTPKYTVLIAASEDNGINNNPQPVLYIADKTTGALVNDPEQHARRQQQRSRRT